MKQRIYINNIVRETEKAILINCLVSYNANAPKGRDIWMPKSVCQVIDERHADVEDWFLAKTSEQNAFHGYRMNFETV